MLKLMNDPYISVVCIFLARREFIASFYWGKNIYNFNRLQDGDSGYEMASRLYGFISGNLIQRGA